MPYASSPCALIRAFSLPPQSVSVPASIFLHMAAATNSRGDSHHSAIEPASATMHDEMKVQPNFWRGVRFSRSRGCYLRCRTRCLHQRYVVSVRSCTAASARRQYICTARFLYTCIRRSETSAGACRRTNGKTTFSVACEMYLSAIQDFPGHCQNRGAGLIRWTSLRVGGTRPSGEFAEHRQKVREMP